MCGPLEMKDETKELEDLVKTANEGFKAYAVLYNKHRDKVNLVDIFGKASGLFKLFFEVRVKSSLTFEPFIVTDGNDTWPVKLKGSWLQIGRKTYLARDVKAILVDLLRNNRTQDSAHVYRATKRGISDGTHVLPWPEAERILKALEEAGV